MTGHAVAIVESAIAGGDLALVLPVVPGVLDALAAAGERDQIAAIVTQLLTPEALQTLLVDATNGALLANVLGAVVGAGQADLLAELLPGLVDQLLAGGNLEQAVRLVIALTDSGALAELPGLVAQIVTPELLRTLLADPANTSLLTSLLESLVGAGQANLVADLLPGIVDDLLAAGELQQVVALVGALAESGTLMAVPALLTGLLTPQLLQALRADPGSLGMVTDLLSSVVQAIVAAGPQLGNVVNLLPTLTGQLQAVVDLVERLVAIVQPLVGPVVTVLGPVADSRSVEQLVAPVVRSSMLAVDGAGFTLSTN